jgi:hypothetical protein
MRSIVGGCEGILDFNNRLPTEVTVDITVSVGTLPFAPKSVKIPGFGTYKQSMLHLGSAPIRWIFNLRATSTLASPVGPVSLPVLVQFSFSTNWKPGDPPCV